MRRLTILVAALMALLLLAACGAADTGDDVTAPDDPLPVEPDEGIGDGAEGNDAVMEITGTLGGDPMLEGGCAWLDGQDGTRYEVQYPEGYQVSTDPVELRGPDGEVLAQEGDELTIRGVVAEDMMSFCQVGTIFTATEVEA
jgi:hypothetical protein